MVPWVTLKWDIVLEGSGESHCACGCVSVGVCPCGWVFVDGCMWMNGCLCRKVLCGCVSM